MKNGGQQNKFCGSLKANRCDLAPTVWNLVRSAFRVSVTNSGDSGKSHSAVVTHILKIGHSRLNISHHHYCPIRDLFCFTRSFQDTMGNGGENEPNPIQFIYIVKVKQDLILLYINEIFRRLAITNKQTHAIFRWSCKYYLLQYLTLCQDHTACSRSPKE